jgi:hypothetical protein
MTRLKGWIPPDDFEVEHTTLDPAGALFTLVHSITAVRPPEQRQAIEDAFDRLRNRGDETSADILTLLEAALAAAGPLSPSEKAAKARAQTTYHRTLDQLWVWFIADESSIDIDSYGATKAVLNEMVRRVRDPSDEEYGSKLLTERTIRRYLKKLSDYRKSINWGPPRD